MRPPSRLSGFLTRSGFSLGFGLASLSPALAQARLDPSNPRYSPTVAVVERVRAAVVNIHSERTVPGSQADDPYHLASPNRVNGMGTGIIVDPRGYIVTNQHVVEDVSVLRVRLSDGATFNARVVAKEAETDLALLKIDAGRPLATIPLGTASDLNVGEPVIAIGNAFGYEHTVTTGVVSATKRDVTLNKEVAYKQLIQTDASINPGNSGGPLINMQGELVGVNVAIRAGAQGIGFAIPVDQMIRVAADLLGGRKRGASHSIAYRDLVEPGTSPAVRKLIIERADVASGVQAGDIVERVGDVAVRTSLDFERALAERPAGDKVAIVVKRDGVDKPAELVLRGAAPVLNTPAELVWRRLGVRLQPAGTDLVSRANPQLHGGLMVADVSRNSVAGRAGLARGDILVGLHTWETTSLDNVLFVLNHPDIASFSPVRYYILRDGQTHKGWLPAGP